MTDEDHSRRRDDVYLTRREAELILSTEADARQQARETHRREHDSEIAALDAALVVTNRDRQTHQVAHDREHQLHADKHANEQGAVTTALDAVARERQIHAEAHEREHLSHMREHILNDKAIEKAEGATNLQFANAATALDTLRKDTDRRINELRNAFEAQANVFRVAITNIEKGDVKSEGKGLGQGSIITYIVTAVGLVGGMLGILIVVANALSAR